MENGGVFLWACCVEVPSANGQGRSLTEVIEDLKEAIALVREDEADE